MLFSWTPWLDGFGWDTSGKESISKLLTLHGLPLEPRGVYGWTTSAGKSCLGQRCQGAPPQVPPHSVPVESPHHMLSSRPFLPYN